MLHALNLFICALKYGCPNSFFLLPTGKKSKAGERIVQYSLPSYDK